MSKVCVIWQCLETTSHSNVDFGSYRLLKCSFVIRNWVYLNAPRLFASDNDDYIIDLAVKYNWLISRNFVKMVLCLLISLCTVS